VSLFNAYAYVRDEKAAGTAGGASTSGSWQTRAINTEVYDPSGIVSVASNRFTLDAGTYQVRAEAPYVASSVVHHRYQNITDGTTIAVGATRYSTTGDTGTIVGRIVSTFTLTGTKAIELQYFCNTSRATDGLGVAINNGVVEVYAEVEIYRLGS
jgi:hypothetical protein